MEITDLINAVRIELQDTTAAIYTDDEIERSIEKAVSLMSRLIPQREMTELSLGDDVTSETLTISSSTGTVAVKPVKALTETITGKTRDTDYTINYITGVVTEVGANLPDGAYTISYSLDRAMFNYKTYIPDCIRIEKIEFPLGTFPAYEVIGDYLKMKGGTSLTANSKFRIYYVKRFDTPTLLTEGEFGSHLDEIVITGAQGNALYDKADYYVQQATSELTSLQSALTALAALTLTMPSAITPPSTPTAGTAPTAPTIGSFPLEPAIGSFPTPPTIDSFPSVPTIGSFPVAPSMDSLPTAPTIGTLPTAPTMDSLPSAPTMGTLPTEPSLGSIPSAPTIGTLPTKPTIGSFPAAPTLGTMPAAVTIGSFPSAPSAPSAPTLTTDLTLPSVPTISDSAPSSPSITFLDVEGALGNAEDEIEKATYTGGYLDTGDAKIDVVTAGENVGTTFGQYATVAIQAAGTFINEALAYMQEKEATLTLYTNDLNKYAAALDRFARNIALYEAQCGAMTTDYANKIAGSIGKYGQQINSYGDDVTNYSVGCTKILNTYASDIDNFEAKSRNIMDEYTQDINEFAMESRNVIDKYTAETAVHDIESRNILEEYTQDINSYTAQARKAVDVYNVEVNAYITDSRVVLEKYTTEVGAYNINSRIVIDKYVAKITAYGSETDAVVSTFVQETTAYGIQCRAITEKFAQLVNSYIAQSRNVIDEFTQDINAYTVQCRDVVDKFTGEVALYTSQSRNVTEEFSQDANIYAVGCRNVTDDFTQDANLYQSDIQKYVGKFDADIDLYGRTYNALVTNYQVQTEGVINEFTSKVGSKTQLASGYNSVAGQFLTVAERLRVKGATLLNQFYSMIGQKIEAQPVTWNEGGYSNTTE